MSVFSFICKHCGPSEHPCEHAMELIELKILRGMQEKQERCCKLIEAMLLEILHILNRPQSATLAVISGGTMPKTVAPGGTFSSLFQEWTGPSGTGTVVPNAGPIAFSSDNPAVATVDPASGAGTALAAGTAIITGVDSVNSLSASDVLTVTAPVAVSATLTLQ